jgi:hypothetical protein
VSRAIVVHVLEYVAIVVYVLEYMAIVVYVLEYVAIVVYVLEYGHSSIRTRVCGHSRYACPTTMPCQLEAVTSLPSSVPGQGSGPGLRLGLGKR